MQFKNKYSFSYLKSGKNVSFGFGECPVKYEVLDKHIPKITKTHFEWIFTFRKIRYEILTPIENVELEDKDKHLLFENSIHCDWDGYKICRKCAKKVYIKDYDSLCGTRLA